MKIFRYRRPSLKTMLGITREKKRLKKELGITEVLKPFRFWSNEKRKIKRRAGYYSPQGRLLRDGLPKPMGCVLMLAITLALAGAGSALLLLR